MSRMGWSKLGRAMAWMTVGVIALVTTAAALGLWHLTHGPEPRVAVSSDGRLWLLICAGVMVAPWWALMAAGLARCNWLRLPPSQKTPPVHSGRARASSSAV